MTETKARPREVVESDVVINRRKLRALLYPLTPVELLRVVMEVIERQRENVFPNYRLSL